MFTSIGLLWNFSSLFFKLWFSFIWKRWDDFHPKVNYRYSLKHLTLKKCWNVLLLSMRSWRNIIKPNESLLFRQWYYTTGGYSNSYLIVTGDEVSFCVTTMYVVPFWWISQLKWHVIIMRQTPTICPVICTASFLRNVRFCVGIIRKICVYVNKLSLLNSSGALTFYDCYFCRILMRIEERLPIYDRYVMYITS